MSSLSQCPPLNKSLTAAIKAFYSSAFWTDIHFVTNTSSVDPKYQLTQNLELFQFWLDLQKVNLLGPHFIKDMFKEQEMLTQQQHCLCLLTNIRSGGSELCI